ncbi:MAG: chloride channel protein [Planctomycetes bacterium]|nr:chloride channel protein [Planctomycetota bacterium]
MMGATLQAPLTALVTLLEMGGSTNILLPGMIGIVTAGLVSRVGFNKESVFHQLLRIRGVRFEVTAMHRSLREVAVLSAVEQSFELQHHLIEIDKVERLIASDTRWTLLHDGKQPVAALLHSELAAQLENLQQKSATETEKAYPPNPPEQGLSGPQIIDLLKLPGSNELPLQLLTLSRIGSLATLDEAYELMIAQGSGGVYVQSEQIDGIDGIFGLLRSSDLERYYK